MKRREERGGYTKTTDNNWLQWLLVVNSVYYVDTDEIQGFFLLLIKIFFVNKIFLFYNEIATFGTENISIIVFISPCYFISEFHNIFVHGMALALGFISILGRGCQQHL